jgi:hypothetical protein
VRNRARPEGSIAEAYIADECLTFCSKYMDDVETRFNREPRNTGFSDEESYGVDVFGHGVRFTSAEEVVYNDPFLDQMSWYVLNNCNQVEEYIKYVIPAVLCYMLPSYGHMALYIDPFIVIAASSEMNCRVKGCLTLRKQCNKDSRHGSGIWLVCVQHLL